MQLLYTAEMIMFVSGITVTYADRSTIQATVTRDEGHLVHPRHAVRLGPLTQLVQPPQPVEPGDGPMSPHPVPLKGDGQR